METEQSRQIENRSREEFAIVLDFLPNGHPSNSRGGRSQPVAQVVGTERFLLLELTPRQGVFLQPYEEVYIGDGKRDKVHHILGRVDLEKLTTTARSELDFVLHDIVKKKPERFVKFFNKAGPLTIRTHSLELLPGFGKKHMWEVLERRQDKDFADLKDLRERVKMVPDPEKAIVRRILEEMGGKEKHYLFVEHPPIHSDSHQR